MYYTKDLSLINTIQTLSKYQHKVLNNSKLKRQIIRNQNIMVAIIQNKTKKTRDKELNTEVVQTTRDH